MALVRKQKMADAVVDEIKRMIEAGELKEGEKLPNQNEFANQLQVSRTSLREALRVLDLRGAIEQRPGFGTVIKKFNPVLFSNAIVVPPMMSDAKGTLELINARLVIEVGAAGLAAENASIQQIELLSELTDDLSSKLAKKSPDIYIKKDINFHLLVAESSNNRFIMYSFENIKEYINQYMHEFFKSMPGLFSSSVEFHRNIFQGIKEQDADKARRAMTEHLETILENYLQYMENTRLP